MEPAIDKNNKKVNESDHIILSLHGQKSRGTRIYFSLKDLEKIKQQYGEDFFLFNEKKIRAQIDPINQTIIISPLDSENITSNDMSNNTFIHSSLDFIETIEDQVEYDFDDYVEPGKSGLDFYMPIEGTGDKYWIAEILVDNDLAYYCVAPSELLLEKEIQRKAKNHFPGLLESNQVKINYFTDDLVHSPVPSSIARNAFKEIAEKKLNGIKIKSSISIPNDADLTPLIDLEKGSINGMVIKKRTLLAKYEIIAIASNSASVKTARIKEVNGKLVWQVITESGDVFLDPITGDQIKIEL